MNDNETSKILKKVRQVEIRTNRMVTDAMAGAYHSVFKGQGMDFEEVRAYAPGDDVRAIDWNVTAKMDQPYIKKFREERELTIMLLVDLSASGSFGSAAQSKRELAAELASVLAFSATRNNDKVGLLLFTDQIEKFVFPQKGRKHVLRLIREMLFFEPQQRGTDVVNALTYVNRLLKRKSITFLISDFLQDQHGQLPNLQTPQQDPLFKTLSLTHQRHDLTCVHLSDPREFELPDIGIITLEDAETGQLVEIDTRRAPARAAYREDNTARRQGLLSQLRKNGINTLSISTDQPYIHVLRKFFESRGKQR